MLTTRTLLAVTTCAMLGSGCASKILSDERIANNTAALMGVSSSDVTISDRREVFPDTYYTARTRAGAKFACSINGGTVLSMGLTNAPSCSAQDGGQAGRSYGRRGLRG